MPGVLHLVDDVDADELRLALHPLLERSPVARWAQHVVALGSRRAAAQVAGRRLTEHIPRNFGLPILSAPRLRRCVARHGIAVVHAWSVRAAYSGLLATGGSVPVVLSCWDPALGGAESAHLLALRDAGAGVLCHTGMVQRRLVERGMSLQRCPVVRPAVDFARINHYKNGARGLLVADPGRLAVMIPPPPSRCGGHLGGLWAVEVASRLEPRLLLLLPGVSDELHGVRNYLRRSPRTIDVRLTGHRHALEQLICAADLLFLPAAGDISATAIAWAMSAGVPVFGYANYCITEFIADGHNGHLIKPQRTARVAGRLLEIVAQRRDNAALYDRARAQAYEVFSSSRYVQQVQQVYDNALAGRPAGSDITDAAKA